MDEVIPYANKDQGTVYDHLKRAIDFSMNHLGDDRMPAGLWADWNDCLRLGKKGESTFVAMQLYWAMSILRGYAEYKEDNQYIEHLNKIQKELGDCQMLNAGRMTDTSVELKRMERSLARKRT